MGFQHELPDATQHHYAPSGVNEDVLLYRGRFRNGDGGRPFEGEVRWSWFPSPHVAARGTRTPTAADVITVFKATSRHGRGLWVDPATVHFDCPGGVLPDQPGTGGVRPVSEGQSTAADVDQQVGNAAGLDRLTFLLANGWRSLDGSEVCAPQHLTHQWPGRVEGSGGGWAVTIDPSPDMDGAAWRELGDVGGKRFTHIGSLTREDGRVFTADDAVEASDRVRVAVNLALGRRTTVGLPVGWRGADPVWTRWRSAPVDPYRPATQWLDETVAASQVGEIVSRVLAFGSDMVQWEALRPAVAYYIAANVDVDVELSVGVSVSALQLLSYHRFVAERRTYSRSQWKDKLSTQDQLRLLLDDIGADLSVHSHFEHLTDVRDRLAQAGTQTDALGAVVRMRNIATHPMRDKPAGFSVYEWAEAGMHARYWLCLALLNTVGYAGKIAKALGPVPRWTGQLGPVPWNATP